MRRTVQQPKVDFATEMVVGVFLGSRPSAGFAVEILAVEEQGRGHGRALPGDGARAGCGRGAGHHVCLSAGGRAQADGRRPLRKAAVAERSEPDTIRGESAFGSAT